MHLRDEVGRVEGPLAVYRVGFWSELVSLGFTSSSTVAQLRLMGHVSRWLARQGLGASDLSPARVAEFAVDRRGAGYSNFLAPGGLVRLRAYLARIGVLVAVPLTPEPSGAVAVVLEGYRRFLADERCVAGKTIARHVGVARRFLEQLGPDGGLDLGLIDGQAVLVFVSAGCSASSTGRGWGVTGPVRGLCRFLFLTGQVRVDWSGVIPRVASWRLSTLPKGLSPDEVAGLFAACEPTRRSGLRDTAILLLMVRLGLRAGEVAGLCLDDIDWRAATIEVRSTKTRRVDQLPLPVDVGDAVAAYLRRGRPSNAGHRFVFCRAQAPQGALSAGGLKSAVVKVSHRAGIGPIGAHRLRHTAATGMLRGGGSLAEIAGVLRHDDLCTTAHYAKVDRDALFELARPWPASGS